MRDWRHDCCARAHVAVGCSHIRKREVSRGYMRQKLAYSQGVLEGLTLENFELVARNGIRIRHIKLTNVLYRVENFLYMQHLTNFQHSVDGLLDASTERDLARATKSYQRVIEAASSVTATTVLINTNSASNHKIMKAKPATNSGAVLLELNAWIAQEGYRLLEAVDVARTLKPSEVESDVYDLLLELDGLAA